MVSHCDFVEQSTINTDEGQLRPDMLVRLPGGKLIVVDSKVPLDAYLSALETTAEEERRPHLARHAKQTREHITKLTSRATSGSSTRHLSSSSCSCRRMGSTRRPSPRTPR